MSDSNVNPALSPKESNRTVPFNPAVDHRRLPIDTHFDTTLANKLARLEMYNKHHYRPNTYMHKWWARRCGSTFRLILKHLVTEPGSENYYSAGGLAGKVVLDPMMGGGTTLHEAIRMGANVIGVDIDPIPVMQARTTLGHVPLETLETAFNDLFQGISTAISDLFITNCPTCLMAMPLRFMLYGLRRYCACGPKLLVDSLILRYEEGQPAIWLCPWCGRVNTQEKPCNCDESGDFRIVMIKKRCQACGQRYKDKVDTPHFARYEPLVAVGHCPDHGLFFASLSEIDLDRLERANALREGLGFGPRDDFRIPLGPKSRDLMARGVENFLDLFSSRQLLYLHAAAKQLPQFDPMIRLNLALLVSTSLEFNSLLCGYKGVRKGIRPGAIRHTFSYHAYTFPYTALENNVIYPQKVSGTLQKLFHDRIRRARLWAAAPKRACIVIRPAICNDFRGS